MADSMYDLNVKATGRAINVYMQSNSSMKRFLLLIFSFGISLVCVALVMIGLCTNNWVEIRERNLYRNSITVHFGLHRICWVNTNRCNNPGNDYDKQNALPIVQGLVIAGGFLTVLATLVALFNFLQNQLGKINGLISAATTAAAALAGILLLAGIIVFAARVKVRDDYISVGLVEWLGYSFGLTTCAGILMIIAAVLSGVTVFHAAA